MRERFGSTPMRVLIGSVGRRTYLVDWFERALAELEIDGEVHVTDADPNASAFGTARRAHRMPRYADHGYEQAMLSLFDELRPDLFFSVNDFELEKLSLSALGTDLASRGGVVLRLEPDRHAAVHDKFLMYKELTSAGIKSPQTALLSDRVGVAQIADSSRELILKDRYGSGSSGLLKVKSEQLGVAREWLLASSSTPGAHEEPGHGVVVQPALSGIEYGVDVVTSLAHSQPEWLGTLAREKLRLRAGETDQAVSVDASAFEPISRALAAWTEHRGLIDVDLIRTSDGTEYVIDINPRFGGGYPFCHLAGANVPALYLTQVSGAKSPQPASYLSYKDGVVSAKHEAVTRTNERERLAQRRRPVVK